MARYRKISPSIWNDTKFRALSDSAKLVFFMLLTHPQTTAIGTMRAFQQGLAPEMGWSEKAFREAFREVTEKGMAVCSEKDGLIWLPNFMKHNPPENPNVLKSWSASLDYCPECALKSKIYENVKAFAEGFGEAFAKAFAEAFRVPLPNQEQEQEQEPELNKTCSHPVPGDEPEEPAVFILPTNKGERYPILQSDIDRWREIYPAVNVEQEIRNMIGWCEGHKSQRKTWGGMAKFITGWLAREQDRGPTMRASPVTSSAPRWNQPVN